MNSIAERETPMMNATILTIKHGIVDMQYVQVAGQNDRHTALKAWQTLHDDASRCDYAVDGAWEIVTESLPMNVLGAVILEVA